MNEILLLVVPIIVIILSVCQKNKTFKAFKDVLYYSKYIILFIPFILMYLKPDFQNKILRFFHEIDKKPMHQNMYDMMHSYMDAKKNSTNLPRNGYGAYNTNNYQDNQQGSYFNNTMPGQTMPMNNRVNMINPKNFIPQGLGAGGAVGTSYGGAVGAGGTSYSGVNGNKGRHKRNVSESKKKYIASTQKWSCAHCQQMLDNTYEVDHVIPLYKGGTNDLTNLEALCRNCHGKKTFKDKMGI